MNILFVIDGLHGGGKERQLVEIIKLLSANNKYIIGVVTFNKNKHYTEFVRKNVYYFKELSKRPTRFEPFFSIWNCFKEFKPDIVHTWDSLSSMYSFLPINFFKIKFIDGSIRDAGIEKGWEKFHKKFFLKRADVVIANSFAGLETYQEKGEVLYNAIDLNRFNQNKNLSDFNIIMTANFTDYKDHKTFIDASIALVKDNIVNNVYLLGEGPYKEKYMNYINESHSEISNKFHFQGRVRDVEDYLALCSVGVLCSTLEYSEGVSNAVLEYMAAGLVPVVTNIGGSAEIITNKKNGFLIPPKSSDEIIRIVKLIKEQPSVKESIVKEALETVKTKFNDKKNIAFLESLYSNLNEKQ